MLAAVERRALGEAGDGVLGRGVGHRVGPRRVRRDRAVVDDATALRRLRLHDLDRLLRAQERAGQDGIDHRLPLLVAQLLHRYSRSTEACIVEQEVEAAERLLGLGEEVLHVLRLAHVGPDGEHLAAPGLRHGNGLIELLLAAAGDDHVPAVALQCQRGRAADAAPSARDERNLALRCHVAPPCPWMMAEICCSLTPSGAPVIREADAYRGGYRGPCRWR